MYGFHSLVFSFPDRLMFINPRTNRGTILVTGASQVSTGINKNLQKIGC